METSRDDFVIAIRSVLLKKSNKQRFSLVFLITLSLIFLTLGRLDFKIINFIKISLNEVVYRSSFIVSIPENFLKNSTNKIKNHFILYKDFEKIKEENKIIKGKNLTSDYLLNENERLKKIIDDYFSTTDSILAKVLIDKKSPFLRSVVLNKGSKDQINLGMAVLDGDYLIGKIVEVNYLTSRVLLLSDLNSKIPVSIEPGGYQSILSGSGKSDGFLQYMKEEHELSDNYEIFSSGSGGIFKSGIPIGTLSNSINKKNKSVKFFSDFTQLNFVRIKKFEKVKN